MGDKKQFSGTICRKCKKGKYHFIELSKEKINGLTAMKLRYQCDKCGHCCYHPYNVKIKNEQVEFGGIKNV